MNNNPKNIRRKRVNNNVKNLKSKRVYRRRKIILVTVLLLLISVPFFLKSNLFRIDKITVKGNVFTNSQNIIQRGSLEKGENYFTISKSKAKREIKKLPYIDNVNIKFNFPGKLTITVSERVALLQIYYDEEYFLIDKDLRVLDKTKEFNPDIIKVTGINMNNYKLGSELYSNEKDISKNEFMSKFLSSKLYEYIKSLEILDDGLQLITKDNIKIMFGAFKNYDYKIRFLEGTLDKIKKENKSVSMILMEKSENPILVLDNEVEKSEIIEEN